MSRFGHDTSVFLNFLRGMETVRGEAVFIQKGAFLNFLRGMETAPKPMEHREIVAS